MYLFLLWASVFLLVCVVGSLGPLALILAVIVGALINLFGSQSIKISFGLQNSFNINAQNVAISVLGIIAGITLGAGLLALSAAALPTAVFAMGAIILYGTAAGIDYLLFWSKNKFRPWMRRSIYV